MRPGLKVLILALSLAALSVQNLAAQPPLDPPPNVELQDAVVVGSDLGLTVAWALDSTAPASASWLILLDSQGGEVGSAAVPPIYGPQTVWIPGGALPRVGDSSTEPMTRHVKLVSASEHEILLENELAVSVNGGYVGILAPRWPLPFFTTGRQCYLHVVSLTCNDPEDNNGDEPYLIFEGFGTWGGLSGVRGIRIMPINQAFLTCDTCVNFKKDTKIKLYDLDDPPFDPHDLLGTENVASCTTTPLKNVKFSGSNYTYFLKYRVACFESPCEP